MVKLRNTRRAIAMTTAVLALASGAAIGLGGSANAATGAPNPATTDWFKLYLANYGAANGTGIYFLVCNEQSAGNNVYVGVTSVTTGKNVLLQDVNTGWQTYGTNINFNAGGCEEFYIKDGIQGDAFNGYIKAPGYYSTGWVTNN